MEYAQIVQKLAACGLDCSRCADYQNGEIKELSTKLLDLLEGYDRLVKIKSKLDPAFKGYNKLKKVLDVFANASCGGCRSENVKCPIDCHAKTCHKDKKVDFCFQCNEFPCDKQFEGKLRERWIEKNNRMKKVGVVDYYIEQRKLPRYGN
ncbi:hypothetical protein A2V47_07520 [Candidatus Atribacteria bacterium RBG_19FT_COMBO_35_14]|uniref:DUF3795 domain-containing protein n=1 Tax=Candidatus Sediminicultor quintus TaxID=1797291 RepID=A0A1F5AAW1_9BACT|nr:MAG: hypothetical protein A2V47_07520 [Candidatus Atribacteria bacterium RBG_19FT_COMBO_35_14]